MIGWIILVIIIVVIVYAVILYNGLVRNRQMAQEAWSGIDVQLKRRTDLIPNLMEAVKGYMGHERQTLEAVTQARAAAQAGVSGTPEERAKLEGQLSSALGRLFAVAEAYPDLKASANFLQFQGELSGIENEIQLSRRYYNGAVRNLNVAVESVPSSLLAGPFGFQKMEYFELENAADRAVPQVKF